MNIIEAFTILKEEMAIRSEVVHHTNLNGLAGILSSRKILPGVYYTSVKSNTNIKDRELATLRRSTDRELTALKRKNRSKYLNKMDSLTENSHGVKIYLFNKEITARLRGVRKRPISEFGKQDRESLKNFIDELYGRLKVENKKIDISDLFSFYKEINKEISSIHAKDPKSFISVTKREDYSSEVFKRLTNKYGYKVTTKDDGYYSDEVFNDNVVSKLITMVKDVHKTREGEERFTFNSDKVKGIPVNKRFMKIRITEDFTKDDIEYYIDEGLLEEYELKSLAINMIRYRDVFIIDEKFRKLEKALENYK